MGLKLITAPASTPVSLVEVKSYMRELTTDQDTLFTSLIAAATSYLDGPNGYLGRAIRIPFGPVASVTSVKYYDTAGSLQTIDSANYAVDLTSSDQWIVPVSTYSWPAVASGINNVIIRFVAGEATAPEAIKAAIHMLIAQWFEMPEASSDKPVTELPHAVSALLANFREYGFGA